MPRIAPPTLLLCLLLGACAQRPERLAAVRATTSPPLELSSTAYEAAAAVLLPEVEPLEGPGLHHVFTLSETIISGAEPAGVEALERLAAWGVKTILSVDGKAPDVEGARALGMRYVHVPIEYGGVSDEEVLKIAKTFRELEGPFYVHCFHGKHRGPAAAAIGRIVLDGIPRERAIAEMRQWSSTAPKYEGLYAAVATADLPTPEETAACAFAFDGTHSFDGLRGAMVQMTRKWDLVKAAKARRWALDPAHPDVVPLQEALQLQGLFEVCLGSPEARSFPDDFRGWLSSGRAGTERLIQALADHAGQVEAGAPAAEAAAAVGEADLAYATIAGSCSSCHATYRD